MELWGSVQQYANTITDMKLIEYLKYKFVQALHDTANEIQF